MESKEATQDTYPYYVDYGSDIDSIDDPSEEFKSLTLEYPILPDVNNLHEAARLCVNDYNSEEGTNLSFVKIIQAERFRACGGFIFLLTIIVQDDDQGEQSVIKKMVWQGALLEVISTEEKPITPEQKEETVNLQQGYELGFAATAFHSGYESCGYRSLLPERVIDFGEIENSNMFSGRIKKGEGYSDISIYHVSVVAKDYDHNNNLFIIKGVLQRSKWILPLDKEMTKSLLDWQQTVRDLDRPPLIGSFPESCRSKPSPSPDYLHNLDLSSPQIVTQAWFAVENYNLKKNTNLKFVRVERAATELGIGVFYKLFITVMDGLSSKIFATEAVEMFFAGLWICTSPFVLHEDPLGEMVQVDMIRY
ncbi:hypothetical protein ACHQM5_000628 [Ranunculus cassubicifolius]